MLAHVQPPPVIAAHAGIQLAGVARPIDSFRAQDCTRLNSRLRGNGGRKILAAPLIFLLGLVTPAFATEWVHCNDAEGLASFDYLAGDGLGVLQVAAITITAGEKVWASDPANGPGDPVQMGQGWEDGESVLIDAVTPDFAPVAELRLSKASEADSYALGGTLRISGFGDWAVSCDAGE